MEKFYLTTAIPYVNAAPHLGHVLEFVQTDAIARYQKMRGKDVALVTGADENSLKNVQAAEKQGITVSELCNRNSEIFRQMCDKVGLSFTSFRRTSDREKHWPGVRKMWELCDKKGDIYKKKYSGLYCVGCEAFYTPEELEDGVCPEHKTKPDEITEENYFFRLSKYRHELERLIESDELSVLPQTRKNEVLSFIKGGLNDFSISRSVARAKGWGVPVPSDPDQIEYVWFDALGTYITGIGYGTDEELFRKFWPADVHVIGKGILRFHAVYWPAMLMSAGLKLPKTVFVHGYITVEGQKMSKSLGNIIDPNYLIGKYGVDQLRYCLLSEPTFEDGDFSEKVLIEKNNNELLANYGNLVNRTLMFIAQNFAGKIPDGKPDAKDLEFISSQEIKIAKYTDLMGRVQIREAVVEFMSIAKAANAYFQENAPWKAVKENPERAAASLYVLSNQIKDLAILGEPILPFTSASIWKQLNIEPRKWDDAGKLSVPAGHAIGTPSHLYRKLEEKELSALRAKHSGKQQKAKEQQKGQKSDGKQKEQPQETKKISISDVDLEVGQIIEVTKHPQAEKLYIEKVQLANNEVRQICSGLALHMPPEALMGKKIILVKNLKPAKLRGVESAGMLLAAEAEGKLEVLSPDVPVGTKVVSKEFPPNPKAQISIDEFFTIKMELKFNALLADGAPLVAGEVNVRSAVLSDAKVS